MKKRIFQSFFIVIAIAVVICMFLRMADFWRYLGVLQENRLEEEVTMVAAGLEHSGLGYLEALGEGECRITWIDTDGDVLYDSHYKPETLPNHNSREEVQMARITGSGTGYRLSETTGENTYYKARLLADGTVLRLSLGRYTVSFLLKEMLLPISLVVVLVLCLSQILARRLTLRVMAPLNHLVLDDPKSEEAYEELQPLLRRLGEQQEQIRDQMEELRRRQDEFAAVTEHMKEGLLLLNESGCIVSVNPAAAALFSLDESCIGRSFLAVERRPEVCEAIQDAMFGGHGETLVYWGNRPFQLDVSPIHFDNTISGAVLLAFDATERVEAEQRRRTFTANVTHELKTPLQTILGSAELIENGLAGAETPHFASRIGVEGRRLVNMIDDIIRLSQLEENLPMDMEPVDLLEMARTAADTLQPAAAARQITLTVEGEPTVVNGVPRLLEEIVYNLYENAIKYNVPGGKVRVLLWDRTLQVSDTGIGIPLEYQSRVFERFYRVDKSHSRQIGGSGLGLSIVKHAARYHKAALELQSEPDKGTTITVRFPE